MNPDRMIALGDLCGLSEVAEMINRSKGRVDQLLLEDPAFPQPIWWLKVGRIWDAQDILAWKKTWRNADKPEAEEVEARAEAKGIKVKPVYAPAKPTEVERAALLDALLGKTS